MHDGGDAETLDQLFCAMQHTSDEKLLRITRMIDRLPERGEADTLLAPMRSRLATLRPARPFNRTRLLFAPLDPVLVPTGTWRPGDPAIPRTLLAPVSVLVLDGRDTPLPGLDPVDQAALTRLGAPVWREAAERLAIRTMPPDWSVPGWRARHGLSPGAAMALLPVLQLVLAEAVALRGLRHADPATTDTVLRRVLAAAAARGPLCWSIVLALLLETAPPEPVTRLATLLARPMRGAAALQEGLDRLVAATLDRLDEAARIAPGEPDTGPVPLDNRRGLMERIEALRGLQHRPAEEQRRIKALQHTIAAGNRMLLERAVSRRERAARERPAVDAATTAGADEVRRLEAEARQVQALAAATDRSAQDNECDRLLDRMAAHYLRDGGRIGLTRVDRLRLAEQLIGSDRAIQAVGLVPSRDVHNPAP